MCEFSLGLFHIDFIAALASLGELNREIAGDLGPDGKVGPSKTALSSGFHTRTEVTQTLALALALTLALIKP